MTEITTANPDLRGYLNQLDETLKTVLLGLSGSVGEVKTVLTKNGEAAEESNKTAVTIAVKMKEEQKKTFDELKSDIIRAADDITQSYETLIEQTKGEIRSDVSKDFVAKSEFGEYKTETASTLTQHADSIEAAVSGAELLNTDYQSYKIETDTALSLLPGSIASQVSESFISKDELQGASLEEYIASRATQTASGITEEFISRLAAISEEMEGYSDGVNGYIADTAAYIRRGELETGVYGIEIGRSDSNMKTRFLNDKISFYQGAVEVAYISDNNLYITRAEVLDFLRIGNSNDGYFTFDVSPNGLEVRWSE